MKQEKAKPNAMVVEEGLCRLAMMWFWIAVLAIMVSSAVSAAPAQTGKQADVQTDLKRLEGRWVRPDGGYVLELGEIKKDGSLKVSYFNPRPIKVFVAKWSRKEGKINLFVDLRDVNYPGFNVHPTVRPKSDWLKGTYFQAVEKKTFNVEFARGK